VVAQRKGPTISVLGDGDVHATTTDYNVWLDPQRMASIAEVIADAINQLAPASDAAFHKNLDRYLGSVAGIDRDYSKTLATCKKREILVEKPQMSSLTSRYGLKQVSVGSLLTKSENSEARSLIEQTKATTVFATKLPSLSDADRIRKTYDVRVAVLDPIAVQTDQARRGGANYREVMELNLDALRAALDCRPKGS
jgi:zinc transport system substrate-binding protein